MAVWTQGWTDWWIGKEVKERRLFSADSGIKLPRKQDIKICRTFYTFDFLPSIICKVGSWVIIEERKTQKTDDNNLNTYLMFVHRLDSVTDVTLLPKSEHNCTNGDLPSSSSICLAPPSFPLTPSSPTAVFKASAICGAYWFDTLLWFQLLPVSSHPYVSFSPHSSFSLSLRGCSLPLELLLPRA